VSYPSLVVTDLSIIGVADPGIPNQERIALRPMQTTLLSQFGVAVGVFDSATGGARLLFDNVFWFPDKVVMPPSWVLIFTGPGQPRDLVLDDGQQGHTFFWQRKTTLFHDVRLVPVLIRVGGAIVGHRL